MNKIKYDLNDPLIHWRCKIEKRQADESYRKMCNHEITHAVLNAIKKHKNRKEDKNA
nr:MAG TPA: hypothetical protein [Caudoviricetes sp.]